MVAISPARLETLFKNFIGKRIAVVGDLMLDRYYWGSVARISPEAPVPVVQVESESTRLGGAANVANNVATLGGIPIVIGVVGDDDAGKTLRSLMLESGFSTEGVVTDPSRPTTVKTRVIAHHQHVVRVDREVKDEINHGLQEKLLDLIKRTAGSFDAIIIQDYNKGVVAKDLIGQLIAFARSKSKIVTVDPKYNNFFEYKQVTVFKPNRMETEEALGCRLTDQQSIERAGRTLVERLQAENVLLTLGERGMVLFERNGTTTHVPTTARKVADVSGAGDTVISTLTVAMAAGATVKESSTLANFAGGIVCGEVGIVPIEGKLLYETVLDHLNNHI